MITPKELFQYEHSHKMYKELCDASDKVTHNMWKWFLGLSEIPHGSYKIEKAAEWYIKWGKKLGGVVMEDKLHNISMKFPGVGNKKDKPAVVLQGHIDMVCTKTADHTFDFEKDPIKMLTVKDETGYWLTADKTTLGGDDGIGVATALAIVEDKDLQRGPIEILLTVDEEVGLDGAMGLKEGHLLSKNAKYLINIDSEDFGEICISCAGGAMRKVHLPFERELVEKDWVSYSLEIRDLKGGHTGVQIQEERGSAVRWVMKLLDQKIPIKISKFDGGNAHNAIPSLCNSEFSIPKKYVEEFEKNCTLIFETLKKKYQKLETNPPKMIIKKIDNNGKIMALPISQSHSLLHSLDAFHSGVFKWSYKVDNLVESSQSLSVVNLLEKKAIYQIFARSSVNEHLALMSDVMEATAKIYGGTLEKCGTDMMGWPADPKSTLLKKSVDTFKKMFNQEPEVTKIHAGLECGIIMNKFPENKLEALSVGPTLKFPHSPAEKLEITTAVDTYKYIMKLVEELSN